MTATEIQQGTRRTISGTVQNPREDGHGHYLIDLQGTGWTQDKYSVTAFEVAGQETLAALPVGRHIEVVVEAQQKREGKDGSRERDWYWRIIGPSNGAAPAPQRAAYQGNPGPHDDAYEQRKETVLSRDPYAASIAMSPRQTALIQASLLAANGVLIPKDGEDIVTTVERGADSFIRWLQGTTAPDTEPGHLVRAAMAIGAQEPEPSAEELDEQASMPGTTVDDLPF